MPTLESPLPAAWSICSRTMGVAEIEGFAQQTITDPKQTYDILEQAVALMEDIKQRANFEVYLKKFLQSMDIILPHTAANPFKIPAKRFGFLLVKVKERYKDDTLSISGAGEKVRQAHQRASGQPGNRPENQARGVAVAKVHPGA